MKPADFHLELRSEPGNWQPPSKNAWHSRSRLLRRAFGLRA